MNKWFSIIGMALLAAAPAGAAVIVHELPQPLDIFNTESPLSIPYPYDVDGNGTTDFTFFASPRTAVGLRTERANRLVIKPSPPPT